MRGFRELDPLAAAVFFASAAGVAMFTVEPVLTAISLFGSVLTFLVLDKKGGKRGHLFFAALFCVLALINPIFYHNGVTVLFVVNDSPITLEACVYGVLSASVIVSVLYWFKSFSLIMTSDKLMYIFGKLSPRLSLILSMALRYIPIMKERARAIDAAQRGMGLYRGDNIADLIKGKLRVFSILSEWALENGIITADSMEARGYGTARRTCFSLFRFTAADALAAGAFTFCGVSAVLIFAFRAEPFRCYPSMSIPDTSPAALIAYALYLALALAPSLLEIKEAIRWRYLTSRI